MKDLLAALLLFTRLPLGGLCVLEQERFGRAICYWPLMGWVTGGFTALLLWGSLQLFPALVAIIIAITGRVLLTGALHEDGLADVCDGFGGGRSREGILAIMKDSHIGAYGVIGLLFYFILLISILYTLPLDRVFGVIIAADVVGKSCASWLSELPYARASKEAKIGMAYEAPRRSRQITILIIALLPLGLVVEVDKLLLSIIAPALTASIGIGYCKRKITGYTGDCCGALFLLCELSFYLYYIANFI